MRTLSEHGKQFNKKINLKWPNWNNAFIKKKINPIIIQFYTYKDNEKLDFVFFSTQTFPVTLELHVIVKGAC
jgi:hypothetical protein